METLYRNIGLLCLIAYITGVISEFIPSGYTNKAIRLTTSIYIITSLLVPVHNTYSFEEFIDIETYNYAEEAENYVIESAEKELESRIEKELSDRNISYNLIDVHINKQSDGLQIDNIYVAGIEEKDKATASLILSAYGNLTLGD